MGRKRKQNKKIPEPLLPGKEQLPHWGRRMTDVFPDSPPPPTTAPLPAISDSTSSFQFVEYEHQSSPSDGPAEDASVPPSVPSQEMTQQRSVSLSRQGSHSRSTRAMSGSSTNTTLEHLTRPARQSLRRRSAPRPSRSSVDQSVNDLEMFNPSGGENSPRAYPPPTLLLPPVENISQYTPSPPATSRSGMHRSLSDEGSSSSHFPSGLSHPQLPFALSGQGDAQYTGTHRAMQHNELCARSSASSSSGLSSTSLNVQTADGTPYASLPGSARHLQQNRSRSYDTDYNIALAPAPYGRYPPSMGDRPSSSHFPATASHLSGLNHRTMAAANSNTFGTSSFGAFPVTPYLTHSPTPQQQLDNNFMAAAGFHTPSSSPYIASERSYSSPSQSPPALSISPSPSNALMLTGTYGTNSGRGLVPPTLSNPQSIQSIPAYLSTLGNNERSSRPEIIFPPNMSYTNLHGQHMHQEPLPFGITSQTVNQGSVNRNQARASNSASQNSELNHALGPHTSYAMNPEPNSSSGGAHTRSFTYPPSHPTHYFNSNSSINPYAELNPTLSKHWGQ
ncbi:hypothetical protein H0H87_011084 [Tephrocybe sp. NHM501043]|nr:hypothetical protein H0H87_011084 [Tephrocybe sp. NHM501043]